MTSGRTKCVPHKTREVKNKTKMLFFVLATLKIRQLEMIKTHNGPEFVPPN
jgi:hypothetical protein